jgi:predicted dehydrogenase
MAQLKLAVIGCGRVAERFHLPALAASPAFATTLLVDPATDQADTLARRFDVPRVCGDFRNVAGEVDAAIVAVPNHLHGPVSVYLLEHGIHVLVEKPMALTTEECDEMIAAGELSGATLSIGLVRRRYAPFRFTKQLLESGILGKVRSFDFREGAVYNWSSASSGNLRRESGGGVLMDLGSHLFDTLLWWLGDVAEVEYRDDALGGVEAECRVRLALTSGAEGVVELSRLRGLRNTYQVRAEHGEVEVALGFDGGVRLSLDGSSSALAGSVSEAKRHVDLSDVFEDQLADFAEAIRSKSPPDVSAEDGRRSIELIQACRQVRQHLRHPWEPEDLGKSYVA